MHVAVLQNTKERKSCKQEKKVMNEYVPRNRTIGLIFFDRHVRATENVREPGILQRIFCGAGAIRARLADAYQNTQRYIHCEIFFKKEDFSEEELKRIRPPDAAACDHEIHEGDLVVAFAAFNNVSRADIARAKGVKSTRQKHGVIGMLRSFASGNYKSLSLRVTDEQFFAAKNFAMRQLGKPYDHAAASWRILIFPPAPSHRRYWCASLAHAILQQCGFLKWNPLNTLDVSNIVSLMSKSRFLEKNSTHPSQRRSELDVLRAIWFVPTKPTGELPDGLLLQIQAEMKEAISESCTQKPLA